MTFGYDLAIITRDNRRETKMDLMERIEANSTYEPNTGCRLWLGASSRGHGVVKDSGQLRYLHRLAWEEAHGEIPMSKWVLHKCGVGLCFNVDHLRLGTRLQNARDRSRHGGYVGRAGGGLEKVIPEIGALNLPKMPRATRIEMTQTEARRIFDYDEVSGVLRWKRRDDRGHDWNMRFVGEEAGALSKAGYRYINILTKLHLAHRLIWLWMTGDQLPPTIDHINGEKADNRWSNLRAATYAQNGANVGLRSTNKSGVKGVSWDRKKSAWVAMITVNGKQTFLGYFATIPEAATARRVAEDQHHGTFAHKGTA